MPVDFSLDNLPEELDLAEIDELADYISAGDVDTERAFNDESENIDVNKNFDAVIVVDGLPKVPIAKAEKLTHVVNTHFSRIGAIQEDGLYMPVGDDEVTLGYAFIAFESAEIAQHALSLFKEGYPFDKAHLLKLFPYTDLQKYASWPEEYKKPEAPEFKAGPDLDSWLADPALRDQYLLRHGDNTEIYWCEGMVMNAQGTLAYDGERERQNGKIWCEMYTAWSPQGSYLATFHRQGIALWGGEKFEKIMRFEHIDVQHISFSPNERFVFTWNGKDDNRDARSLICWDVKTGREMRSFKVSKQENDEPAEWPVMKWSADDKYFARKTTNGISVFETETFRLVEKKPLKAKGIVHFEWSPSDPILAYWAPEVDNQPARVVLIDPATRQEVRSKNLFNVREVKLHWQNSGDFLCAQVLRHSKTGKTTFTNFEIFRMRDNMIPGEMIEMKDIVEAFAWEPSRERFALVHGENQHRLNVSIFSMGAIRNGAKVEKTFSIENKQVATLHWSPAGNNLILAGKSINGNLEFWDIDEQTCTAEEEHFMCNEIAWDPSGRMVASIVTQPMFGSVAMKFQLENGFSVWNLFGESLRKEQMEHFYQFAWRPRPKTKLTEKEVNKIKNNLKTYIDRYSKDDEVRRKRLEASANKDRIEALSSFRNLVAARQAEAAKVQEERIKSGLIVPQDSEQYEVIEETVEEFVSETVEPFFG